MARIDKLDLVTVFSSANLTDDDLSTLCLLYNPLIKKEAYNLYMLLYSLIDRSTLQSQTINHQFLLDVLSFSNDELYKSRVKLEAIGLLSTYYNNGKYIYLIKNPLTAKQFFVDGVLGVYLYTEIGEENFKKISKMFHIPRIDKTNYSDITKNFDDVFKTEEVKCEIENEDYFLGKKPNTGIKLSYVNFDFDKFIDNVKTFLPDNRRVTKRFENTIKNLAYAYGFNEDIMAVVFKQSLSNVGTLDYSLLNKNAKEEYTFHYENSLPKIAIKDTIQNDDLYKAYSEVPAEYIIKTYSKNKIALPQELKIIADLYHEFSNLDRAVINMCIVRILKFKDGDVPNYKYFAMALNGWIKDGITTFEAAKKYCLDGVEKEKKVAPKRKSTSSNSKNPEWLNDAMSNVMDGVDEL